MSVATRKNGRNSEVPQPDSGNPETGEFSAGKRYDHADFKDFRHLAGLPKAAGASLELLHAVVAKELVDNALDAGGEVTYKASSVEGEDGARERIELCVENRGPCLPGTPEQIAELFSFGRPRSSSKSILTPSRGVLGNGLRVVAGVVFASGGSLQVTVDNKAISLRPLLDGTTEVVDVHDTGSSFKGTHVAVTIGKHLAPKCDMGKLFAWCEDARGFLNGGEKYKGKTVADWYSPTDFFELLNAAAFPVEHVVSDFEGFSARTAARDLLGADYGRLGNSFKQDEAKRLLDRMKAETKPFNVRRLGQVGTDDRFPGYAIRRGFATAGAGISVPFVVEAWARRSASPVTKFAVNRSPIIRHTSLTRDKVHSSDPADDKHYRILGVNTHNAPFKVGHKSKGEFFLYVSVITPVVPLTSSGKDPDLSFLQREIALACGKAIAKEKVANPVAEVRRHPEGGHPGPH